MTVPHASKQNTIANTRPKRASARRAVTRRLMMVSNNGVTAMTKTELQAEALERAQSGNSMTNIPTIYAGFIEKGISEADIKPRENVLTFNAWKAKGRSVMKGQHGVRVTTMVPVSCSMSLRPSLRKKPRRGGRPSAASVASVRRQAKDRRSMRRGLPMIPASKPLTVGSKARAMLYVQRFLDWLDSFEPEDQAGM